MAPRRLKLIISVVAVVVLMVVGYYVWHFSSEKPQCNCVFSQTREYGVIKDGECVVVDCKVKPK